MVNFLIGLVAGLIAGALLAYNYAGKLIADAQNAKARIENEFERLKAKMK